jgi:flagellar P-ring protein precursor FlgI
MMAPLHGPDDKVYALAQGPLSVGGFRYDAFGNVVQKNHPTVGQVPGGATLEQGLYVSFVSPAGNLFIVLDEPDFTTAKRAADALNARLPPMGDRDIVRAQAVDASRILVHVSPAERTDLVSMISQIENATLTPDEVARVVINERTGTVVSGGDVRIGEITVTHGELRVTVASDYLVSQPQVIGRASAGIRTAVVPDADIKVTEGEGPVVSLASGASISELVLALNKVKVSPRDMISVLQAIKRAGSLRAELVIQ